MFRRVRSDGWTRPIARQWAQLDDTLDRIDLDKLIGAIEVLRTLIER
jgi:hypothetical protein